MRYPLLIRNKIFTLENLQKQILRWQLFDRKLVFTNGCFDILHQGHLEVLSHAATLGDILIVGVNSDRSVTALKGPHRPVNDETFRSLMLASLTIVDVVIIFDQDTPLELIKAIRPGILVKGGDYKIDQIAGAREVLEYGGEVKLVPLIDGYSTTALINKIQRL
jgi:rfaE bifunctional protein nucleotidyltransferase chain/domain